MKTLLKALLPAPILQALKYQVRWRPMVRDWERTRELVQPSTFTNRPSKLLVFPADPDTVSGSLGDEAMMSSVVDYYRELNDKIIIFMFCRTHEAEEHIYRKGFVPIRLPGDANIASEIYGVLKSGNYDELVILGADIMDGYYNPVLSASVIIMADIAGRIGIRTTILGFSFNSSPARELGHFFDNLDPSVRVNLRDEVSLARFRRFSTRKAQLVADSAFMMRPGHLDDATSEWVADRKASGLTVLGFNLHPMLKKSASVDEIRLTARTAAEAMLAISAVEPIAWLLLPHDYRDEMGIGDGISLRLVEEYLSDGGADRFRYFEGNHHASVLKAVAGLMDGMVTARMHLAIGALGMGVPTMCVTYQDKFEGLFRHFGLPDDLLLSPKVLERRDDFLLEIERFVQRLPELRRLVAERLPYVMRASSSNFSPPSRSSDF